MSLIMPSAPVLMARATGLRRSIKKLVQVIRVKGAWTDTFVDQMCQDLSHRLLPMLVDLGGCPSERDKRMLQQCTHSILLLREDDQASKSFWLKLTESCGLLPLARLTSELSGPLLLLATEPVITGTLTGLERGSLVSGELFAALVERISALFTSYSQEDLERIYLSYAPADLVVSLPPLLQSIAPGANRWDPAMLPALLEYIPPATPLSVYGQGPHWLYGALAAHTWPQPFYQFDPRFPRREASPGWLAPPTLSMSTQSDADVTARLAASEGCTVLSINIVKKHLDYLQATGLPFPPVPAHQGLILDGSMPSWLLTALVRLYIDRDADSEMDKQTDDGGHTGERLPWIACYQPSLRGAVIVFSRTSEYPVGTCVVLPARN